MESRGRGPAGLHELLLAWREAVAAAAARLASSPRGGRGAVEALSTASPPPLQDGRVVVTTGNAPKVLYRLLAFCREEGCQPDAAAALEELWAARPTAYQLHNAYTVGPEHARSTRPPPQGCPCLHERGALRTAVLVSAPSASPVS